MDLFIFSTECTSRLELIFFCSFHNTIKINKVPVTKHRSGKISNQNLPMSPGGFIMWRCIFNFPSCTFSVLMRFARVRENSTSVSIWSQRGIKDMDKVSVRKWKLNQCCLLVPDSWFWVWLGFLMIWKLMRKNWISTNWRRIEKFLGIDYEMHFNFVDQMLNFPAFLMKIHLLQRNFHSSERVKLCF